jgi:hypothetical protein
LQLIVLPRGAGPEAVKRVLDVSRGVEQPIEYDLFASGTGVDEGATQCLPQLIRKARGVGQRTGGHRLDWRLSGRGYLGSGHH